MRRFGALFLALGLLVGMASGPLAEPARAGSLKVCGEVTVYVKATALGTGLLTINGIPFVILAGVNLPASVAVGADICADLATNLAGLITGAAVTANVHTHLRVCGDVTAYTAATASAAGLLKIGTHTFTLAIGSHLPASVDVGADLCIDLELDGFGRVADGTVTANAHVSLKVCGEVTAYAAATATATGLLKIASHTWTLAIDSHLPASVTVGADICIDLTLDGYGRVSDGTVSADVEAHVRICGTVTAYAAATSTADGILKIAGRSFVTAVGSDLPASVTSGANLCMDLALNGFAQVKDGTAVANVTSTLDVCGQVTAYAAATSTTDGSLTHAGVARKIAAGAGIDAGIAAGAFVNLRLTTDAFARVADATVLKAGATLAAACGSGAPLPSPAPSSGPGQTPGPGSSGGPGATPGPTASAEPGTSGAPGASNDPGASNTPGASAEPDASSAPGDTPSPTIEVGGIGDCQSGVGAASSNRDGETLLPSTDSIERVTGVVAANTLPLLVIGLLGGIAAWYRAGRRREDEIVVTDEAPEARS
ncbi:MAG TPA: hypothetical protein VHL56_00085 [Candidatus Limnocylindrales bacterium]|nr:hypothetical protein [Candidatus Limnocylindrales bacterium]